MPARKDDPLQKVTLNLYEADVLLLQTVVGFGWSEYVRQVVHEACEAKRLAGRNRTAAKTLGDLQSE